MRHCWLTICLMGLALACGGKAAETVNGDPEPKAGDEFACGNAECSSSQLCVYPPYGCGAIVPEGGVCPAGSMLTAPNGSVGGACVSAQPMPSCMTLNPGEGSFDCSGGDAGIECDNVSAPIPERCGRICRADCG
jgi:hypothetical protein